jgi:hypothetical protein
MIYHGTAAKNLESIRRHGLLPTDDIGIKTNWKAVPSKLGCVYLSKAYALYYGQAGGDYESPFALIEVDETKLDPTRMLPDEDFIAEVFKEGHRMGGQLPDEFLDASGIEELTNRIDPRRFRSLLEDCQTYFGNVVYEGVIPPEAISRVAILSWEEQHILRHLALDATPTPINHYLVGRTYRELCTAAISGQDHPLTRLKSSEYMKVKNYCVLTATDRQTGHQTYDRVEGLNRARLCEERGITPNDHRATPQQHAIYRCSIQSWFQKAVIG